MIIKESERAVIFRIGKTYRVIGPGVYSLIPFYEKVKRVDMNTLFTALVH
ncbi:MAG: SPFH domain-containing protein [Synechococcus sp.]